MSQKQTDLLKKNKKSIAILIDPDKFVNSNYSKTIELINVSKADFVFIGGSTVSLKDFKKSMDYLYGQVSCPIIIFPGASDQFDERADAILYLSLLSGRNADFLIGHHVRSAEQIYKSGVDVIPTGYILVDGGSASSVAYVSQTTPIPRDGFSIAKNTAIAGLLQGKQAIFLDAGSGAKLSVPLKMITDIRSLNVPVIVGGGISSVEQIETYHTAGADIVVIGNKIEDNPEFLLDIRGYLGNLTSKLSC